MRYLIIRSSLSQNCLTYLLYVLELNDRDRSIDLTLAKDRLPERSWDPQAQGEVLRVLSIDASDSVDLK